MMSSAPETPVAHGIPLISPRQALPNSHRFQSIFPYDWFNAVQSKCFPDAYGSTDNFVVSAPTGSGKTVILELAICKMLMDRNSENYKVVYQAPTKALCSERARDWQKKFGPQGFRCAELTGDTSQAETRRVSEATIIVTTPEKWDAITRKWDDHRRLLELVKLFLIDEVHILRDIRGATLEAVVSRMKSIGNNVRFVALSATVPNSHDVASWLGLNHMNPDLQARLETFSEDFRPVKLTRHIQSFNVMDSEHGFDKFLESKIPPLLMAHAQGKPTLIFCFTKKSSEAMAAYLAQWWTTFDTDKKPWSGPSNTLPISSRLRELAKTGVVFHHSGLEPRDRAMVEQAFIRGDLKVICCTSTLAVGINLPCHTVVLKGTSGYQDGRLQELSDMDVLQMLGRAGRPQYDTTANAVILTHARTVERYKKLVTGKEILESTLHLNLMEHLNSEIGLRTITDIDSALRWLKGTFLSVRLQQNPDYYKLTDGATSVQDIDLRLREICERDIRLLAEENIVSTNSGFKQTEYGKIMARYMVGFSTMKLLLGIPRGTNMEQLVSDPGLLIRQDVFCILTFRCAVALDQSGQ
jgi:ATP-dependent DNA helicase HFM1/MER3